MARIDRELRVHQVKISLCRQDAEEVASWARSEGVGSGTLVRLITLRHLTALTKSGGAARKTPSMINHDKDKVKFGAYISAWFTNSEYIQLHDLAAVYQLTVSGYLGRCVVERSLVARRNRLAIPPGAPKPPQL